MSSAIIMNLTAIAAVVTGWTVAVAVFYTRLSDSPARPRTASGHEVIGFPTAATRSEPVLAGERAA